MAAFYTSSLPLILLLCCSVSGFTWPTLWPDSKTDSDAISNSCDTKNKIFVCVGGNLTKIPSSLPEDVKMVIVDSNKIQEITLDASWYQLRNLSVRYNRLESLDRKPFYAAGASLVHLHLTGNSISKVSASYFEGLENLQYLSLDENQISELQIGTFDVEILPKLLQLDLQSNKLASLDPDFFRGQMELQRLRLRSNQLTSLSGFFSLKNLTHLDASSNKFETLNADTFRGLHRLNYLSVADNSITDLGASLNRLPHLIYLNLSGNKIAKMNSTWFNGTALQTLLLNNNPLLVLDRPLVPRSVGLTMRSISISYCPALTRIRSRAFSFMWSLFDVTISGNPVLQRIDGGLLEVVVAAHNLTVTITDNGLPLLQRDAIETTVFGSLDLKNNALKCGCQLQWLADQCKTRADKCAGSNGSVTCLDASTKKSVDLVSLTGPTCDPDPYDVTSMRRSRTMAIGAIGIILTVLLVLSFTGLAVWYYFKRGNRSCNWIYSSTWGSRGTTSGYRYSEVQAKNIQQTIRGDNEESMPNNEAQAAV